jgi:hypothetical protein
MYKCLANTKFEICMSSGSHLRLIVYVLTKVPVKLVGSVCPDCTVSSSEHKNISWGNKLYGMGGGLN